MPVYVFSTAGGAVPTSDSFRATTWCKGQRVDLAWTAPTASVTEYRLKRSTRAFSLVYEDDIPEVYVGTDLFYSDTGLEDDTVYYYTLYYTTDGTEWITGDSQRVAGLSIAVPETDWLYKQLPQQLRMKDAELGVNQYTLKRYCDVMQCGLDRIRGEIRVFRNLSNYDKTPAGRIGEAKNQYGILEAINKEFGFEPIRALGVEVMRRVALGVNRVRKQKGTCNGLTEYVKMLTGWDGECADSTSLGSCGGGTTIRTWDGVSGIITGSGVVSPDGTSSTLSFDDPSNTYFADSAAAWTAQILRDGVFLDSFGNYFCVEDNTETQLTFKAPPGVPELERLYAAADISGLGTDTLVITQTSGSRPFNTGMYTGYQLKEDAAGGAVFDIEDSVASANGLQLTLTLSGATDAAADAVSVTKLFANEPQTYADREITFQYEVRYGTHSHLWDPLADERLRGGAEDPFDVLWDGNLFATNPLGVSDVVFWVNEDTAEHVGVVTDVTGNVLTVDQLLVDGELVGAGLNPNRNQNELIRIVSNTTSTITVEATVDLADYTRVNSHFYVLDHMNAVRFQALVETVSRVLPDTLTKLYIWFR